MAVFSEMKTSLNINDDNETDAQSTRKIYYERKGLKEQTIQKYKRTGQKLHFFDRNNNFH